MKNVILLSFVLLSNINLFGKSFEDINKIIETKFEKATLTKLLEEEKYIYSTNPNHSTLLNIVYIEQALFSINNDVHKKLKKLLWITENTQQEDFLIDIYSNYHLASLLLDQNSNQIAINYALKSLNIAIENEINSIIPTAMSLVATIYFHQKKYDKAEEYYRKAFKKVSIKNMLFKSSMLNNISLCKLKKEEIVSSIEYNLYSLFYLNKIKNLTNEEEIFKIIVEGNLGSNYLKINQLEKAKNLLEKEIDYYFKKNIYLETAYKPCSELIDIYEKTNDYKSLNNLILKILQIENNTNNLNTKYYFSKILFNHYHNKNDFNNIKKYSIKYFKLKDKIVDSINENANQLNAILFSQEIKHVKKIFNSNQKIFKSSLKNNRNFTFFIIIIFVLFIILFLTLYIDQKKTIAKNIFIKKQNDEIERNQKLLLENEIKLNNEKITNLSLNLTIKKETEKAFLLKIKEIKKKNNNEIEQVLFELHHQVLNLLNIDKKNNENILFNESLKYKNKLKEIHPELNEVELALCVYFKLRLNSKEISALNNMTPGSIRVYKSKIKDKINLKKEDNLNEYLSSILI